MTIFFIKNRKNDEIITEEGDKMAEITTVFKTDTETGITRDITESVIVRDNKQIDYCIKQQYINETYKDYGPFIFLLYTPGKELPFDILPASLTRLIYLSTFLSYRGFLVTDRGDSIDKESCKLLLKVSDDTFWDFWNEMIEHNIFTYTDEKRIHLNKQFFTKGKKSKEDIAMRLNCIAVRSLYENCKSVTGHKNLSYIFKAIPWINREWNIACWNPEEIERNKIQYMRLGDFCDKVGYDRTNAKRLVKSLSHIKFTFSAELCNKSAFLYVIDADVSPEQWIIVMNPLVYYGGKNYKNVTGFEF